jgi:pyruvate-ferredoxin/flavodoxin oxidoreductase
LRFLRGLLEPSPRREAPLPGSAVALDGLSAVATTEARVCDSAALAASFPAAAGARVWNRHETVGGANELGRPLTSVAADSARGALAVAMGMALSGQRATAFFSGPDLAAAQDILAEAAGRHLPLVLHLACRASGGPTQALGSGHEAYMAARDAGLVQLFAANAQEAVDLALIGRRVAERALVPVLVAMDGEQTAAAVQDVRLPEAELVSEYLGESGRNIEPPTEAQRMLFGDTRRLVPRTYDLDRPMLLGALQGPESWAYARAAARPYFDAEVAGMLAEAAAELQRLTGRSYQPLIEHRLDDARIVLLAQGAAVESAIAVADSARGDGKPVGVIGLRYLRPFPGPELARHLGVPRAAAVLERLDAPLSAEGPLLQEVRAACARADENDRFGDSTHPGYPEIAAARSARLISVPYGLGGLPLRAADLLALVDELEAPKRSLVYLGLDFIRDRSPYPKRQALADSLRRSHGDLAGLGLRATGPAADVRAAGSVSVAVHRLAGDGDDGLAAEAASLLMETAGGGVRSRAALTWQRFNEPCVDWLIHARADVRDPGDDGPVDVAVLAADRVHPRMHPCQRMIKGGTLLLAGDLDGEELWASLPERVRKSIQAHAVDVRLAPVPGSEAVGDRSVRREALLGALLSLCLERSGGARPSAGKIRAARATALADLGEEERERRLDVFVAAFESVGRLEAQALPALAGKDAVDIKAPMIVRRFGRADNTLECLPRFWDQVGILYHSGETEDLWADPYLGAGAVPPMSAAFRDVSAARPMLPVFDPATCDGSGRLWTTCPDGSVAPLVISPRALIEAGIDMASAKGKPADTLRGVVGRLAKRVVKIVKEGEAPLEARSLLRQAFAWLMERTEDGDRKTSLQEAFEAVVAEVGDLPLARTDPFFDDAEKAAPDSGELFSLVVDPDSCKSVDLLLAECEGQGLRAVEQTPESLETARRLRDLWQRLPDTSGQTIARVRAHPAVGPLAAMMLSRHCLLAMTGGDGAEAASGAKLALREVLAAAEYQLQPRLQEHLAQIADLRGQLADKIREVLAAGLPADDLDALAEGLDLLGSDSVPLASLSSKVDAAVSGGRVDGARLSRLVEVARGLADLDWRLSKGADGLGRARAGLAIAPGAVAAWCGVFPFNPFQGPVAIEASGETGQFARGLIEGQLRQALSGLRLLRWARLELERPAEAPREAADLALLRYGDLDEHERRLCPPVLVVGDGQSFGDRGLAQISWLLGSGLPVKIVVLGEIGGAADSGLGVDALGAYPSAERLDLALLAVLGRRAFVAQTSTVAGAHFADNVVRALAFDGPALVHVHAPSPQRHGFAATRLHEQARIAVASRAFPLLVFDPSAEGVFGSLLDLSGNPDADKALPEEGERRLTPVDWAVTEERFSVHFEPLADDDPTPTPIDAYLDLALADRAGRTPFVTVGEGDAAPRLRVADALVADADERLRLWRTLQELAGVVTPFTDKVRAQAENEVAASHKTEVDALKAEYEARLASLRAEYEAEATDRVARGLMALAGYAKRGAEV